MTPTMTLNRPSDAASERVSGECLAAVSRLVVAGQVWQGSDLSRHVRATHMSPISSILSTSCQMRCRTLYSARAGSVLKPKRTSLMQASSVAIHAAKGISRSASIAAKTRCRWQRYDRRRPRPLATAFRRADRDLKPHLGHLLEPENWIILPGAASEAVRVEANHLLLLRKQAKHRR